MTTSGKPSHTAPEQSPEPEGGERDKAGEPSGGWGTVIFFMAIFAILGALVFWPLTKQFIPGLADPPTIEPLGPVLQTRFVGGFVTRTEVRTQGKVLLLRDPVEIDAGVAVERRITLLDNELCVSGTKHCHEIVSR